MALLLNIDTATEIASISISENEEVIGSAINLDQKDHASFLQPAIKDLLQKAHLSINKLNAIAVTAGPGSYTGLRVGMASAKGLCYALNIALITVSTLEVMALSSIKQIQDPSSWYCPMIDARRMEVFTAVYDHQLTEIIQPCSMILDGESYKDLLEKNKIYFSGSGATKLKEILNNKNAAYTTNEFDPASMAALSYKNFKENNFANVSYAAPVYLKEFYTPLTKG
jgi:tRNA threonylcarbamoyladenosine biosynthesis protein TsaB